ncbi:Peroxidase 50 [Platanthera guangdongensis]|uniref:Peroxidase n=1 Tax=Platanthera guangdongensis TaxID=2320717 RepID=A0ABR2MFK8_9ASPA
MEKMIILLLGVVNLSLFVQPGSAQLRQNFYADICPNVESIVRNAVTQKFQQTIITIPATLRLFFHDCFVNGCDASVMVASTANNKAEKDNPDNLSLAGDGFDTVIKAKAAVDAVPQCTNKVSCADILAMAARDVVSLSGGPSYAVELGRLDGLSSTAASVNGRLPQPTFHLNQLTSIFATNGISQTDMIALSAAHTVGFSHCNRFSNRIYDFGGQAGAIDPTLNRTYAAQLQSECPRNVDPSVAIELDPITPRTFDNQYFRNLQLRMGLLTSDQTLAEDGISRPTVNTWAADSAAFSRAFVTAMTNLGRVGVKTRAPLGNIRRDCSVLN